MNRTRYIFLCSNVKKLSFRCLVQAQVVIESDGFKMS